MDLHREVHREVPAFLQQPPKAWDEPAEVPALLEKQVVCLHEIRFGPNTGKACSLFSVAPPRGYKLGIPTCNSHLGDEESEKYQPELDELLLEHPETICPLCNELLFDHRGEESLPGELLQDFHLQELPEEAGGAQAGPLQVRCLSAFAHARSPEWGV